MAGLGAAQGVAITRVGSLTEAIELAEQRKREGTHDWFRGQGKNWPLVSSYMRLPSAGQDEAKQRMGRFQAWARATPGLEELAKDADMALAVAQHHGLATPFVDFTTEPSVAGFFAADGGHDGEGVVLCLNTGEMLEFWERMPKEYPLPECLGLRVKNLWRLEAQHGKFLFCPYDKFERLYDLDRIVFPHGEASAIPRSRIYPPRQSPLEVLLQQFFMKEELLRGTKAIREMNLFRHVVIGTPNALGNADLVNGEFPPPLASWNGLEPWLAHDPEPLHLGNPPEMRVRAAGTPARQGQALREDVEALLRQPGIRAVPVVFRSEEGKPQAFLGQLWDGVRRLPFSDAEVAAGLATALELHARQAQEGLSLREACRACWGKAVAVEFGAADGSYSRGFASDEDLRSAARADVGSYLNPTHAAKVSASGHGLLQAIHVPRRLFEFGPFASLFARQVAPTQVLGRRDAVLYSPARVARFGLQ